MSDVGQKLQALLDGQIGKGHIHNVVAAVQSQDRSLDFVGAAGIADPATGTAMTADTPYFIASVSKMYAAATVMRLHQEKRLDLEAPITRYLPAALTRGIHVFKGTDYSDRIKVVELVNQTSGLADYEMGKPKGGLSVFDQLKAGHDLALDTAEAIEIARGLSPHFPPGTPGKAYYASTNYTLLGAIIESVTGESLAATLEEMIYRPLGLRRTYVFDWTKPRPGQAPATIYVKEMPANVAKYISCAAADGGLVSTASEQIVFLRAFFEGRLFDKALLPRMMTWNPIFYPLRYGYGLMQFHVPRFLSLRAFPEIVGHSGSSGSFAFACPARSMFLAGTVNQADSPSRCFRLMIRLISAAR
jgi:CubicO group peptidase (beta-lactamase class C family)